MLPHLSCTTSHSSRRRWRAHCERFAREAAKAWVDRPTALAWADQVIKPFIAAERAAQVADGTSRYLLFQDNLDSQKQPDYLNALKAALPTHPHAHTHTHTAPTTHPRNTLTQTPL